MATEWRKQRKYERAYRYWRSKGLDIHAAHAASKKSCRGKNAATGEK